MSKEAREDGLTDAEHCEHLRILKHVASRMGFEGRYAEIERAAEAVADEDEQAYAIGVRDGFGEAVQIIDRLTGGEGEYRYCTDHDPEHHCPTPIEMIRRIIGKKAALSAPLSADDAPKPQSEEGVIVLQLARGPVEVDTSIAPIVAALNAAGAETAASCSGHGFRPGNIALRDGREIIIARNFTEGRRIDRLFPIGADAEPIECSADDAGLCERLRAYLDAGPYVVFDPDIEAYYGGPNASWREELLDAQQFYVRADAEAVTLEDGENLLGLLVEPYSKHDRPGEWRLLSEAAARIEALSRTASEEA